ATLVNQGTLLINGSQTNSPVTVAGGTLGGSGLCGAITVLGGALSPGASPGMLTVLGNLALTNLATCVFELNGTNAGADYDQINVTGAVDLAACALSLSLGFAPAVSNSFTLIANDGTDAVTNIFGGFPDGAVFVVNNTRFKLTYAGGPGSNDVVLSVLP